MTPEHDPPQRPDLARVRTHLRWLVGVIVVLVSSLLWLTFHLYARFTEGIVVTP